MNEVAKELTSVIQDAVKVSVVDSIQSVLVNNVVAEANHEVKKSWAKIASGEQEKLMTDVVPELHMPYWRLKLLEHEVCLSH